MGPCGGGIAASCRGTAHSGADERDGARRGARRSPVGLLTGAVKSAGEADVALIVGVPMDFRLGFGGVFGSTTQLIVADRVEPAREHPRPVAAGLYGDLTATLSALAGSGGTDHQGWIEELATAETMARDLEKAELVDDRIPLHPMRVYAELAALLERDALVVIDAGDFGSYAGRMIDSYLPGCWLDSGPFGCLGSGPGYALAAKLARPQRQVVLLQGDGAFGFSGMEWDTLVRHNVAVVSVIGNNGIWGLEKHPMEALYGYSVVAELRPGTRYDEVVRALGGHGELVSVPAELRPALERALPVACPLWSTCSPTQAWLIHADPTWLDVQPGRERARLSTNCGLSVYRHAPSRPAGIRVPLVCAQDHPRSTRPAEQPILAIARRQHRKEPEPLLADVTASAEYDKEAADLSDEKLRKAAGLLNLDDLAESADIPQFLAIARKPPSGGPGCDHLMCSCLARCACSPET